MANTEDNLRSALEMPAADDAFRAELRRRFIDFGRVASRESGDQERAPGSTRPRGKLFRLGVMAAAVAAAVFVTFYLPSEAQWRLENPEALDGVVVDGEPLDSGDLGQLLSALRRGAHLSTSDEALNLDLSMGLRMRVLPNSSIEFGPLPEPGSHHELDFELIAGEVFLETGSGYPGNPIRIATVDVEVMVTGTALGVMLDERGTCTCVAHGEVMVTRAAHPLEPGEAVESRHAFFVLRDAEPRRLDFEHAAEAAHVQPLERFAALK